MVSKCANPVCSARFQYLNTGRLFAIEHRSYWLGCRSAPSPEITKSFDRLRCFWLCHSCCQAMTIQASGGGGIRLAPRRRDDSPVGILAPHAGVQQSQGTLPVASDPEASEFAASAAPRVVTAEDVLRALKRELEFLKNGGYRSPMGWRAPLFFEDSPICPRPAFSACPNADCVLMNFVPKKSRCQKVPCRHISLNEEDETLQSLYVTATNEQIEQALRKWLCKAIAGLELFGYE